jgi:hypothetical protein
MRTRALSNSVLDLHSEAEVVEEINKLWVEAQEKFLAIGRYLCRAKLRFPGAFEKTIVSALPFGKNIAYQLRAVAEAVDAGRFGEDDLPKSYSTAYRLVSLQPGDLAAARAQGLVRNDVTRPELEAFRRKLRARRLDAVGKHEGLLAERVTLVVQLNQIQARIDLIDAQLGVTAEQPHQEDVDAIVM